ncbi:hypothetical protein OPS25_04175 [Alteromonas ponticola]|uniref:Sulfotransferase family protein n=1 Tax=Alteromonas aquimaris TaxID=2998417 RepID=A0ABT3P4K8_9ALTE|nr:hypothetical protein [Alteromonas aquimaris]MCW8107699.1 hypothetical protein [Alteromonas aquimaris]
MKIILHIGNGKCGSSSIQHYFSYNHSQPGFRYGVLKKSGDILTGLAVEQEAIKKPSNYAVSYSMPTSVDEGFISRFKNSLTALSSEDCETLLLSSESFGSNVARFKQLDPVLKRHRVEVIMIVRPPVQWLNSAWWQWLTWNNSQSSAAGIDDAVAKENVPKTWLKRISRFEALDCVHNVHVLALNNTFLDDVKALIGKHHFADKHDTLIKAHNAASSRELLSFLKAKRSLRPDHSHAKTEFILNKHLQPRSKSDWVLTKNHVQLLIEKNKPYNLQLAALISNENILENEAWWSTDFYQEKCNNVQQDYKLSYATLEELLEEAYHIIIALDDRLRHQSRKERLNELKPEMGTEAYQFEDDFLSPDEVLTVVTSAEKLAKFDVKQAMKLLLIAQRSRPNGQVIQERIKECEKIQRTGLVRRAATLIGMVPKLIKTGLKH